LKSINATFAAIVAVALAFYYLHSTSSKKSDPPPGTPETVEEELIRTASPTQVHPDYRPVLIYRYTTPDVPYFVQAGTLIQAQSGPLIIAAEHLLQRDYLGQYFAILYLSPNVTNMTTGIESIYMRVSFL
jgi:hypothetical protein